MKFWSKPSQQSNLSSTTSAVVEASALSDNAANHSLEQDTNMKEPRLGIDLSLEQLINLRQQPIIPWLKPQSRVKTNLAGGFRSRFKGRGMDFDEVRLYQVGDDIRNIDWKVTARTGDAHTKLFKEERERPVFALLDLMPSMFFGTTQAFKSIVASKIMADIMWNALANGDRFGGILYSNHHHLEIKPSSNRRQCMRLLQQIVDNHQMSLKQTFLATANNTTSNTTKTNATKTSAETTNLTDTTHSAKKPNNSNNLFSQALKRLKFIAKPGSLLHIISDFNQFDQACKNHLSQLSQHVDIHCVLVSDPIEQNLPPAGSYGITNGENKATLNTRDQQTRQAYQQEFLNKVETVKSFALSHRGLFSHIDTSYQLVASSHTAHQQRASQKSSPQKVAR
jgi:uncharacterized protein (DUF58 family)